MRLTGHLVDRFGAGVLPVVMVAFAVVGVLPAFAGSPVAPGAALLLLGALSGATLAINAAGVHAETGSQRTLMNLAHAWFSVGVVVASLNTAALRAAGASPRLVLGAVFILVTVIAVFALIPGSLRTRDESSQDTTSPFPELSAPRRGARKWRSALPLIVFGCLGALAYLVETPGRAGVPYTWRPRLTPVPG